MQGPRWCMSGKKYRFVPGVGACGGQIYLDMWEAFVLAPAQTARSAALAQAGVCEGAAPGSPASPGAEKEAEGGKKRAGKPKV